MADATDLEPAERDLPESTYTHLRAAGHFAVPPTVLARLALSAEAADVADYARGLVPTESDGYARPGDVVENAARLVTGAQEVLTRAVIAERARGTSWADIGEALGGVSRQAAQERYRVHIADWERGLDAPYTHSAGGQILNAQLPEAALTPRTVATRLDEWVHRHHEPGDPGHDARPVSGVLDDPTGWDTRLMSAVLGASSRLVESLRRRLVPAPIAEHVLLERRVAALEALLVTRPGDVETIDTLTDIRGRLNAIRGRGDDAPAGPGLRRPPVTDPPYDDD